MFVRFLRPIVVGLLVSIVGLSVVIPSVAYAQQPTFSQTGEYIPTNQNYDTFKQNLDRTNATGQVNTDSYLGSVVIDRVVLGLLHMLVGDLASDDAITRANATDTGIIGFVGNTIGMVYEAKPASGVAYVHDMLENAKIVQPAYAQTSVGQGFNRIAPLQKFWQATANLAYIFYVPIFLYIGIMIMLRQKIGGGMASIQVALPRIIVSLLLVFLSFAIVGFMIDLMYLSMAVMVEYFKQQGLIKPDLFGNDPNSIYNRNLVTFFWRPGNEGANIVGIAGVTGDAVGDIIKDVIHVPIIKSVFGIGFNGFIRFLVAIALGIMLFQTLFVLLRAYIGILASIIMAPLYLGLHAIPGTKTAMQWFRNLLANLVVFPAVLAVILFAGILGHVDGIVGANNPDAVTFVQSGGKNQPQWVPPFLGAWGSNDGIENFTGFIVFGAIMMLPNTLKTLQSFFRTTNISPNMGPTNMANNWLSSWANSRAKDKNNQPAQTRQRVQETEAANDKSTRVGGG